LQRRITSLKCKLRNTLAQYNADVAGLFTRRGQEYLAKLRLESEDRFVVQAWQDHLQHLERQLSDADLRLRQFATTAALSEREARAVLESVPQVGPVTIDVVLSELGDWRRFRSQKAVAAFAGLDPGVRQSARKRQDLHITKEGSRLLRWAMVQAAWRLVGHSPRWQKIYQNIAGNTGSKKKAIVAVARRLLCVMFAVLQSGQAYRLVA
jgi:transposase